MSRYTGLAISLLLAAAYLGLVGLIGARLWQTISFLSVAQPTAGVVEAVRVVVDSEDGDQGFLTVRYVPAHGDELRAEGRTPFRYRWPAVGEGVEVLYHPERPREVEVGPWWRLWPGLLIGLLFMAPVALFFGWWFVAELRELLPRRRRAAP